MEGWTGGRLDGWTGGPVDRETSIPASVASSSVSESDDTVSPIPKTLATRALLLGYCRRPPFWLERFTSIVTPARVDARLTLA